jgi:hypothetical protein
MSDEKRAADEPKNALDDKSLCDALTEALRHAFVPGMQTADGSPFQFVDLMSDPGTDISTGIDRIESFAENVTDEVMELLPQDSIVTDIKLRSIDEAERIYRAVQPPRDEYLDKYAPEHVREASDFLTEVMCNYADRARTLGNQKDEARASLIGTAVDFLTHWLHQQPTVTKGTAL